MMRCLHNVSYILCCILSRLHSNPFDKLKMKTGHCSILLKKKKAVNTELTQKNIKNSTILSWLWVGSHNFHRFDNTVIFSLKTLTLMLMYLFLSVSVLWCRYNQKYCINNITVYSICFTLSDPCSFEMISDFRETLVRSKNPPKFLGYLLLLI